MEKIAVSIAEAVEITSISRSRLYELIKVGALPTRKSGRLTIILMDDLKTFIASLPATGDPE